MSDENEGTEGGQGIANLRKEFENLKKQLNERDQQLAAYQAAEKQRTVAEVLKAKGLPEKAASLYHGDDASEEAVGKWIEDFGDVFGASKQTTAAEQEAAQKAAEIARVQQAAFGQLPVVGQPQTPGQLVVDPVEALAAMKSLPYEQLVQQGFLPNVAGTMWDTHAK